MFFFFPSKTSPIHKKNFPPLSTSFLPPSLLLRVPSAYKTLMTKPSQMEIRKLEGVEGLKEGGYWSKGEVDLHKNINHGG